MDGTKLPLFVVFKDTPGDKIEESLDSIAPAGIMCAVNKKHG